jgi:hypothetical protein
MAVVVPFKPNSSAYQVFKVNIGGSVVSLRVLWNSRDSAWYMDIDSPVNSVRSLKLVSLAPLVPYAKSLGVHGNFFVLRNSNDAVTPISYHELGKSWVLVWLKEGEYLDGL